jgi:hypothetical protein
MTNVRGVVLTEEGGAAMLRSKNRQARWWILVVDNRPTVGGKR